MKKWNFVTATVLSLFMLASSCTQSTEQKNENADSQIQDKVQCETTQDEEHQEIFFLIPTPDELYDLIKKGELNYKSDIVSAQSNAKLYAESYAQAINLGIYSADLAYAAAFNNHQQTMEYFQTVYELSEKLGLNNVFGEDFSERIKNNLENTDSLVMISKEYYFKVTNYLETNKKSETHAIISSGGWIESLYLATQIIDKFDVKNEAIQRIAEQRLVLENIIKLLETFKNNPKVVKLKIELKKLKMVFSQIEVNKKKVTAKHVGDKIVIGGGEENIISKENFDDIKEKITTLRQAIVENKL